MEEEVQGLLANQAIMVLPLRGPIHKWSVFSTEEGWFTLSSRQFEATEYLCAETLFQNGRTREGKRPATTR